MKILAVDTSTNTATAAILEDNKVLAEKVINFKKTHSQTLMPMIDEILQDTATDAAEIDLYVVANGPGSFTGLRIGVSTIKGMAHAQDKPVVEVSTLEGLAYNLFGCEYIVAPILDARRAQVYNGVYEWKDGVCMEITEPRALSIEECVEDLKRYNRKIVFLGDGVPVHYEYIIESMGDMAIFASASCNDQRASSLAVAGMVRIEEQKSSREVAPFYLRKPQAERELEERSKK